jgi:glycosyltransferase involved in cell wall biosynthesis
VRVAYVCADSGVPVFGSRGSSIHVQEVVRALRSLGDDVVLFASRIGGDAPRDFAGLTVRQLSRKSAYDGREKERAALAANANLREMLTAEGPFDFVYERHSLWSFAAMELARDQDIAALIEVNAPLVEEQEEHRALYDRTAAERAARRAFESASAILAVSHEVARWVESRTTASGRVHVVPNGVRPERFSGAETIRSRPRGSFTVGFVGSLKPWHGLPVLAEAFAELHRRDPASLLLVVGDGPDRRSFEADLEQRGLAPWAHLTGKVASEDIPALLAKMDAAVAPYPSTERLYFSPLKVYEYMAAALPIVATRGGQLAGVLKDGVDALLCPAGDADALAGALDSLRRDRQLRLRLGRSAREKAVRDHTWEGVARRIRGIVAGEKAAQRSSAVAGGLA